jgi:hypothetical protein
MPACIHGVSPLGACPICTPPGSIKDDDGDRRMVICGDMKYEEESAGWYVCTLDPHVIEVPHYHELVEQYRARRSPKFPWPASVGNLPPEGPEAGGPLGSRERRDRMGEGNFHPPRPSEEDNENVTSGPLPAGVEGHPVGRGMASVAEVSAAFAAANGKIEEAQQAIHGALVMQEEASQMAAAAADGSGFEAVHVALAALTDSAVHLQDALAANENAREQFQTYIGSL